LLSSSAFHQEKIRKSVWKEKFDHWLPIYINADHAARARLPFRNSLQRIAGSSNYSSLHAVSLLPKLMNTMVVSVMSGNVHASIKALEGYCWFHRLLLQAVTENPALQKYVDDKIRDFLSTYEGSSKRAVPALGEWLPLLSVSKFYSWKDVGIPYIKENFDRNVKWVLQKFPELKRSQMPEGAADMTRLSATFEATRVSTRLCMFHVYFLRVARPAGESLQAIAKSYDAFYGMPSHDLKEALQKEIFRIHDVETWPQFFKYVGIKCPSPEQLTGWLLLAVKNSAKKGYHY